MKEPFKCNECGGTHFEIEDLDGMGVGYQCVACGYYHTRWSTEITVHEDHTEGFSGFYFSDGENCQSETFNLKHTILQMKFFKDLNIEVSNLTNINWKVYIGE